MIPKAKFVEISKRYNEDKNLARLLYRIIRNNDTMLNELQLKRMVEKFTHIDMSSQIQSLVEAEMTIIVTRFKNKKIEEGCTIIDTSGYSVSYVKDGKVLEEDLEANWLPIQTEIQRRKFSKFNKALETIQETGYVQSVIDNKVTKYKSIK